mmetsp:Transcript_39271/g.79321  ORF Transcript_39271/g.79321 Transcript_39271/m.79321 type:complete len:164 (-) Transcript_39271:34-525(-)
MAAADDNPFRVHAQDQKYLRDQQDSAVAERKDQLLNSAAAARPSEMRWTPEDDRVGVAGIGPDVPVRNFNNPVLPKPTWFADRDYKACICCKAPFTTFKCRRHHCRGCGLVFCNACTPPPKMFLPLHFSRKTAQRCCGTCARSLVPLQSALHAQYGAAPKSLI